MINRVPSVRTSGKVWSEYVKPFVVQPEAAASDLNFRIPVGELHTQNKSCYLKWKNEGRRRAQNVMDPSQYLSRHWKKRTNSKKMQCCNKLCSSNTKCELQRKSEEKE